MIRWQTIMNPIITLLLEEDIVLLPEPGVGQVAGVGLRLASEEGVLRDVHCDVHWRCHDEWRACGKYATI